MKPLRWKRLQLGEQIQEGQTVWDKVVEFDELPVEQLASLFCRAPSANPRTASTQPGTQPGGAVAGLGTELRIIDNTFQRCGRESAITKLPPADRVARALRAFDGAELVAAAPPGADLTELLRLLKDNTCPTPAQLQKLESAKALNPEMPLGRIEQYMWDISRVFGFQERLDCWLYCNTCEEEFERVRTNLLQFEAVLACFWSVSIPSLLGVILSIGNYLNGSTKAGQADGFQLDLLRQGGIDAVRDNQSNGDLRRFVISVFLAHRRKDAVTLLADMRPALKNIRRTLECVDGGSLKLKKQVRTSLERTCDDALMRVRQEFSEREQTLQVIGGGISSLCGGELLPATFVEKFHGIGERVEELQRFRDSVAAKYTRLLEWFHHPVDECSEQFFLLWDDLLIPRECFENQQPIKVKSILKPVFCDEAGDIDVYSLGRLWQVEFGGLSLERVSTPRGARQPRAQSAVAAPRGRHNSIKNNAPLDATPLRAWRRTPSVPVAAQQIPASSSGAGTTPLTADTLALPDGGVLDLANDSATNAETWPQPQLNLLTTRKDFVFLALEPTPLRKWRRTPSVPLAAEQIPVPPSAMDTTSPPSPPTAEVVTPTDARGEDFENISAAVPVSPPGDSEGDAIGAGAWPELRIENIAICLEATGMSNPDLLLINSPTPGPTTCFRDVCTAHVAASLAGTQSAIHVAPASPLAGATKVKLHAANSVPRAPACGPPPQQCRRRPRRT
jgi:hypothetical protein